MVKNIIRLAVLRKRYEKVCSTLEHLNEEAFELEKAIAYEQEKEVQ